MDSTRVKQVLITKSFEIIWCNNWRQTQFSYKYKKRTAEEWENVLFTDEWTDCFFQLPNPKNDVVWGS